MSKVHVKSGVLKWAMARSKRSVNELSPRFGRIRDWLQGDQLPTLRQLEEFAKATATPIGLLVLDAPPDDTLPIQTFRTVDDKLIRRPSADLVETVNSMERRQGWMRDYLIEEGGDPLSFVASCGVDESPIDIAQRMRAALRLEGSWASSSATWEDALRRLREAIDEAGILIVVNGIVGNNTSRPLDVAEFRGFVLVDEYAPLIFVNGADVKAAQMFTIAHELAHVFLGASGVFDLERLMPASDDIEQACNRIAAEFLVPEALLRQAWPVVSKDDQPFSLLARQFKTSEIVAARRALDLDLIDLTAFLRFYKLYVSRVKTVKKKGGDFYASQTFRVGNRFGAAVVRAVREGRLSYTHAYTLTDMQGKTFDTYASGFVG